MGEARFTEETPAESGWYWLKPDPTHYPGLPVGVQRPLMVAVYKKRGEFWFKDTINHEEYPCLGNGRLWAGPLTPPE